MSIYQFKDFSPQIDPTAYIADNSTIIGKVQIDAHASIWFGATVRGDNELIHIGENSNVQEACVLHTDIGYPLSLGKNVTVGHQAMLHGCQIEDGCLIGIQAVILNGAKIGKNCLIGAGALVTEGKEFPDNSLIVGAPAKVIRELTPEEILKMQANSAHYVSGAQEYKTQLKRLD
ncbi:MAG: gamma carbonic anhydrase family protein [Undibacterium sp.]|nr:gamma carbonic anhydrase family protein [Undibacterium sp.]